MEKTLKPIVTALRKIGGLGSFCADAIMPSEALSIKIEGLGNLKFPLTSGNLKKLIALAKPAHFGWQDQTLLDKTVRNTWEIPGELITLTWKDPLEPVLDQLKNDLGLPQNSVLEATLHNFLIYEPGQFFKPHQDSEKLDGMVASLVVILPYDHLGGALVVDHHGEKRKIIGGSRDKLTLAAFYADCLHEVELVKSGYRLSLTFNLTIKQATHENISPSLPPQEELTEILGTYFSEEHCVAPTKYGAYEPMKLVYLLDHEYTEKGLSWERLKNGDSVRTQALRQVAQSLGLDAHLVLTEVREVWDCEMRENPLRLKQNGKPSQKRQETYIICEETSLIHWLDENGTVLPYKEYHAKNEIVCWTKATNDFKPFESEFEKWMGNYGNTMEHWYHRAAVVLWRKKDHYAVMFEMNPIACLSLFLDPVKNMPTETLQEAVSSLLPYWPTFMNRHGEKISTKSLLKLALKVKDEHLAKGLIKHLNMNVIVLDHLKGVMSLAQTYQSHWFSDILNCWSEEKRHHTNAPFEGFFDLITKLMGCDVGDVKTKKRSIEWLLSYQWQKLISAHLESSKRQPLLAFARECPKRFHQLLDLLWSCQYIDQQELQNEVIDHIIDHPELYTPLELADSLLECYRSSPKINQKSLDLEKIRTYVLKTLQLEQSQTLRHKDDWSIKEKPNCRCADCLVLAEYLTSDSEIQYEWAIGKDRREHILEKLNFLGLPIDVSINKTKNPYRLILTKTEDLYNEAEAKRKRIEKKIEKFEKLN